MNDMEAQLERLRTDAEDCALISKLATNPHKRELFARLADHLAVLAGEVERAIGERGRKREAQGRRTALMSKSTGRLCE
ncbi:hypothetical protein [Bradyrhizobium retamae]|uniref:Uncharacterized protein n=1 Tax=Bradyrhizobium retamae TaxID=1300035 RepID=A0A0R3MK51_9BRAD|nr:hypothetical protein [Bradyrhizobium retamae]KRR20014.1 hypothetical protein CQ13_08815 [Bradyrhizobium retamae]